MALASIAARSSAPSTAQTAPAEPAEPEAPAPSAAEAPTAPAAPVALFKKRKPNKASLRKRASPPPDKANSDSESSFSSSEDETGHRVKRRKKATAVITASSKDNTRKGADDLKPTIYEAKRDGITSVNDATKSAEWFEEGVNDSMSAANLLGKTRAMPSSSSQPDGTYRGLAAQKQQTFINKNPDSQSRTVGPVKAPSNIRTITVTDFVPDVCKDYKQTGFCGFGDNCKYLHAREDYKAGWQLDKEWENVTKGQKNLRGTTVASASRRGGEQDEDEGDEEAMLEGIPFACIICREGYKHPIVTKCGHYFCEGCALKRYRKDPSCAACGSGTGGVFNVAKNLRKLLDRKREMKRLRRERAREAGEEVTDTEDDEE